MEWRKGDLNAELPFAPLGHGLPSEAEASAEEEELLSDAEVDGLARELLEVTSEAELDLFLGNVFKRIGRFAKKGLGVVAKGLKAVAPIALPLLGKVAGTAFGGPLGGMIGSKLGSLAGKAFGGELEGETYDERELEMARRYVRFAALSAQRFAPAAGESAQEAAVRSMSEAARRLGAGAPLGSSLRPRTAGRWVRRGRRLILYL